MKSRNYNEINESQWTWKKAFVADSGSFGSAAATDGAGVEAVQGKRNEAYGFDSVTSEADTEAFSSTHSSKASFSSSERLLKARSARRQSAAWRACWRCGRCEDIDAEDEVDDDEVTATEAAAAADIEVGKHSVASSSDSSGCSSSSFSSQSNGLDALFLPPASATRVRTTKNKQTSHWWCQYAGRYGTYNRRLKQIWLIHLRLSRESPCHPHQHYRKDW